MNPLIEFSYVKIGKVFNLNGEDYVKKSDSTARMKCNGRIFNIGNNELVYTFHHTKEGV